MADHSEYFDDDDDDEQAYETPGAYPDDDDVFEVGIDNDDASVVQEGRTPISHILRCKHPGDSASCY